MKDINAENWGLLIDRIDNVIAAFELPLPAGFQVKQSKSILMQISKEMKAVFVDENGENPWEE